MIDDTVINHTIEIQSKLINNQIHLCDKKLQIIYEYSNLSKGF